MVALGLLAGGLMLTNLGNHHLWQDEAQTALIARTVLADGIPRGTDGVNYFSQELGVEYGDDYVWKWHTWLSFYLVAASFALLGETTLAARLPFALLGIGSVLLTYAAGRALWRDRRAAAAGATLLALSVPYLVLMRQARWYAAAACFSLLGLYAYARMRPGERRPVVLLVVAGTLLFHTHYFYVATLLATLLLHAALLERDRLRPTIVASAVVILVNLPWILWFLGVRYGDSYAEQLFSPAWALFFGPRFFGLLWTTFVAWPLLLAPVALVAERAIRGERQTGVSAASLRGVALLVLLCVVTIVLLSLVTPGGYARYLTPLGPVCFLLVGLPAGALLRRSAPLGVAAIAAWLVYAAWVVPPRSAHWNALPHFAYEVTHDFDGPIEGIVEFLEQNASEGDVVGITYGDLPLKFYTDLRIVGGLTGEDIEAARDAQWIIPRRSALTKEEKRVRGALQSYLSREHYRPYTLDYADTTFHNRETMHAHRFGTAPESWPRLVIFGRKR